MIRRSLSRAWIGRLIDCGFRGEVMAVEAKFGPGYHAVAL